MPLANETAVVNLSLDHLGEPYLEDYLTDTTTAGQSARVHFRQCVETVLEGHVWSFATRRSQLISAILDSVAATGTLDPTGTANAITFTAVQAGPAGNDISVTILEPPTEIPYGTVEWGYPLTNGGIEFSITGAAITVTPRDFILISGGPFTSDGSAAVVFPKLFAVGLIAAGGTYERYSSTGLISNTGIWYEYYHGGGGVWYLQKKDTNTVLARWLLISDDPTGDGLTLAAESPATGTAVATLSQFTAAELVAALTASDEVSALIEAELVDAGTGQIAASTVTLSGGAPGSSVYAPAYGSAFNLPEDCLRLLKIDGFDIDAPRVRFEIQGRYLLLEETLAEAPVISYITATPPVDEWPTTFTDAVAFLLAARMAPKINQNAALTASLLQLHEQALGKARSKDARETRSAENFGPRQLAARSGLVRSRYNRTYSVPLCPPPES